jgi:hypothetical protein
MSSIAQKPRTSQAHVEIALAEPIVAHIIANDSATAEGITVTSASPILALCRALLAAGFDPNRPLHVYRGTTLALYVLSLGQGAALEIAPGGVGFVRHRPRAAPPVRFSRAGRRTVPPAAERAP